MYQMWFTWQSMTESWNNACIVHDWPTICLSLSLSFAFACAGDDNRFIERYNGSYRTTLCTEISAFIFHAGRVLVRASRLESRSRETENFICTLGISLSASANMRITLSLIKQTAMHSSVSSLCRDIHIYILVADKQLLCTATKRINGWLQFQLPDGFNSFTSIDWYIVLSK